ncbi:MAG: cytochrome c maturation protein CcmE [Phototrophicaceae bacterium]|jgi:cytochrome c-type biogenesis protein CcmE
MSSITAWEKDQVAPSARPKAKFNARWLYLAGGLLLFSAAAFLMISGTVSGARYFITVDELLADNSYVGGGTVRITGVVIGSTIHYDTSNANNPVITFTIANLPDGYADLGTALHEAANNPDATTLPIRVENEAMPDLLQHEAQAIVTGRLDENGVFQADELLLKCPSRFQEDGAEPSLADEV